MKNLFLACAFFIGAGTSGFLLQSCSTSNGNNSENDLPSTVENIPELLERRAETGSDEERNTIRTTYDNSVIAIKNNAEDYKSYINLVTVFITEGRITGDLGYYNNAAMQILDHIIDKHPANKDIEFQALSYKSAVLLSMHQFPQALDIAKKALIIDDRTASIYGALVDAYVELGNYDEAVKMCDKMLSIRPELRSYARASYIRQIYGDNRGAIDAMRLAVESGVPGAENTEWSRVTLADLYLSTGALDTAELLYRESLIRRPNYVYAEMGMSKVEKAKKNYDEAIKHTENAIRIMSESSFISSLADLYELKGDVEKAQEIRKDVLDLLEDAEKEQNKEEARVKHNGARELAIAHLKQGRFDEALAYAKEDLAVRPENIDANELIAWIYYLKGDYPTAQIHANKMLKTNVKSANTLYKAGLIYTKAGDAEKGAKLMQEAKSISLYIDPLLK